MPTNPTDTPRRPNILFILTDQQSSTMMSCAGNPNLRTPAMDRLARQGVRFDRAYCTDPVCIPSRFSLMTGQLPSAINLAGNDCRDVPADLAPITSRGLGWLLADAGYEPAYGGKVHLPRFGVKDIGFETITTDERDGLADACADFLGAPHDRPFCLVASFINPHDICYMAIRESQATDEERDLIRRGGVEVETLEEALAQAGSVEDCPPLPANFEPQIGEPEAVRKLLARRSFREKARREFTEAQWRLHRWAYCRLTERVDAQIGRVLDALDRSTYADNTVVIFTSDHGDHDGSHRMEHKTVYYEEAVRIPLIVRWPGVATAGLVHGALVSNGLDLLPTLCDIAGAEVPADLAGRSLRRLLTGRTPDDWRAAVPIEAEIGRYLVTERYKYVRCFDGADAEQLLDLQTDPGETRNAASDPDKQEALAEHRRLFDDLFGPP